MKRVFFACLLFVSSHSIVCYGQTFSEVSVGLSSGAFNPVFNWVDVDRDLDLDLIVVDNPIRLYKNNAGLFTESFDHNLPGVSNPAIGVSDFDLDGNMDLVITGTVIDPSQSLFAKLYLNDGSGSFTPSLFANLPPLRSGSVDCGDFDQDGDADLLLTGLNYQTIAQSLIYSNNGDGSFSQLTTVNLLGVDGGSGKWGDYDGDGDLDILIGGRNFVDNNGSKPATRIYRNNSNQDFSDETGNLPQVQGKADWVDFNQDGFLDVFVSGSQNFTSKSLLLIQQANHTFSSLSIPLTNDWVSSVQWADFDNDGDRDLLARNSQDLNTFIYLNMSGTSLAVLPSTNFPNLQIVSVCDIDGDRDPDILFGGYDQTFAPVLKMFRNTISTSNASPTIPLGLTSELLSGNRMKLSWNTSSDAETNALALTYFISLGTSTGGVQVISPPASPSGVVLSLNSIQPSTSKSIVLNNLANGTYYARVQAMDENLNVSALSSEVNFTISGSPIIPLSPSDLTVRNLNGNFIEAVWKDKSNNEDNVVIERGETSSSFPVPIVLPKNSTSYIDKNIDFEKQYFYRVKAVNGNGSSAYSNVTNLTSLPKGLFVKQEGFQQPISQKSDATTATWADFNGDSYEDILFASFENKLYKNQTNGTFLKLANTNFIPFNSYVRMTVWGDYDNDGDEDVFFTTGSGDNKLFKNNGDETFTEALPSFFTANFIDSSDADWVDYDNDGYLDLFIVNINSPSSLFHNNKNGTFTKIEQIPLVNETGSFISSSWCDYDNDGLQDVLIANYFGSLILYRNIGNGVFKKEVNNLSNSNSASVGASWADYDKDGDFDVLIANNVNGPDFFFENNGDGSFTEVINKIQQSDVRCSSSSWGDFDNDGNIDLAVVTDAEKYIFKNTGAKDFILIDNEGSLSDKAYASGVAFGDYNKDGFLDLLVANTTNENLLLKNSGNANHWISFKLVGMQSNKSAIGARIRIKSDGQWQTDFVSSSTGNGSANSFPIEFGLGSNTNVDSVIVGWPGKGFQVLTNVASKQFVTLVEPAFLGPTHLLSVSESQGKIDIAWNDMTANETGFYIERSISTRHKFKKLIFVGANVTSYQDPLSVEGDSVFYRISVMNASGYSWYSNVKGVLVNLNRPTDLTVVVSGTSLSLNWTDNSNVETSYVIQKSLDLPSPTFLNEGTVGQNLSSFNSVINEEATAYQFRVFARKNQQASDYSNIANGTSGLNSPTNLTALWNGTATKLSWSDNSSKESNYVVERSENDNKSFGTLKTVVASTFSFDDVEVDASKTYFYRVKAIANSLESNYSNEATTFVTGLSEKEVITFSPNPTDDFISIYGLAGVTEEIEVISLTGVPVADWNVSGLAEFRIDLKMLPSGHYIFKLLKENKWHFHRVVVK